MHISTPTFQRKNILLKKGNLIIKPHGSKIRDFIFYYTGCSTYIFDFSRAHDSENMHFWPHVVKAKMRFQGVHLFHKL